MSQSKQELLVKSIVDGVVDAMRQLIEQQTKASAEQHAAAQVALAAISARLEALEAGGAGPAPGAKRAPRGERKTGGGKPAAAKPAADDKYSKVKNSLLYFRRMWVDDPDFREKYSTDETEKLIANDVNVGKKKGDDRLGAEAGLIWKSFSAATKDQIKAEFEKWKKDRESEAFEDPLTADDE